MARDIILDDINIPEGTLEGLIILDLSANFTGYITTIIVDHRAVFDRFFFRLESSSRIKTKLTIDRDAMAVQLGHPHNPVRFVVVFNALDTTTLAPIMSVTVNIRILDINDNVPMFPDPFVSLLLDEGLPAINAASNTYIPSAEDNDEGNNTVLTYTLRSVNSEEGVFELDVRRDDDGFPDQLRLLQIQELDRERRSNYMLEIVATEGGVNPASATAVVNVTVDDTCDEPPRFPVSRYITMVEENSIEAPIILNNITTEDTDTIPPPTVTYTINDVCSYRTTEECAIIPENQYPFMLDMESGNLTLTLELDWEDSSQYEITILAEDNCFYTGTTTVVVTVLNINDNAPDVSIRIGTGFVTEELTTMPAVYFIGVQDDDYGTRSNQHLFFTYQLLDNSTGTPMKTSLFQVQTSPTLAIRVVQPLDREVAGEYMLLLNVTDWDSPNMSTVLPLPIFIRDVNDHSPVIQGISALDPIPENLDPSVVIVDLNVVDMDSVESGYGRVVFLLPQSNSSYPHQHLFSIDEHGRLTANGTLDREQHEFLSVLVQARDSPDSSIYRSDFIVVNLTLMDLNDNIPLILTPPETVTVSESQSTNTVIFTVTASDIDTPLFSTLTFSLTADDVPFHIDPTNGSVTLVTPLDYETQTNYTLEVRASDGTEIGRRTVTVFVANENDERCVFEGHHTRHRFSKTDPQIAWPT